MVLVNNTNNVYKLAEFDLGYPNINFHEISKKPFEQTNGSYSVLDNVFLSLCIFNNKIYLRAGINDYILKKLKFRHFSKYGKSKLIIWENKKKIFTLNYKISLGLKDKLLSFLSFDQALDMEELDYGLYIYNINRNNERQKIILDGTL